MAELAHGEVRVTVDDSGVGMALRRVEADFDRTMSNIDRREAEIRLKANAGEFDAEIKHAEQEIERLKRERASVTLSADKRRFDREIRNLERDVAFANRMKIEVKADVDTKAAQSEIRDLRALDDARIKAEQKNHDQRMRLINVEAKRRSALSDQRSREFRRDEADAHRADVTRDKELMQIVSLQREYAKLSRQAEALSKRHAFTREQRVELDLDTSKVYAQMLAVKATLSRLGHHPPIEIETQVDRRGLQRVTGAFGDLARKIGRGASGLSDMTIRFGPFTASVRQAGVALAFLGPLITDLIGGTTALAGVLFNAGLGFGALSAGLAGGLIANFAGVAASLHPMVADFKIAHQATQAYTKAVDQYGAHSKQATLAQDKMNRTLATVDPTVADAVRNMSKLGGEWRKLTQSTTRSDVGMMMTQSLKTLHTALPTLARNTNQTMNIVTGAWSHMMERIRANSKGPGGGILGSLGRSANNFLAPALRGAEHLGAALAHVAESAARIWGGKAGTGFMKWADGLDKATKPGKELDARMTRLGNQARDVGKLFMDFGRLLVTVLGGGAHAGDNLVKQLDHAIVSWNTALKTPQGQHNMAEFFRRASDSVSSLAGALAPLIGAFAQWSNMLSPFTRGIFDAISFITRLVGGFTKLMNMSGGLKASFTALGATLASLWALGKMSSFVAMLSRVVGLMKEARKAGGAFAAFKTFFGGLSGALKGGGGQAAALEGAFRTGSAELRTAILEALTQGAGELSTAITSAGATAGTEQATAITEAGAVSGTEQGAAITRAGAVAGTEEATAITEAGAVAGEEMAAGTVGGGALGGAGAGLAGGLLGRVKGFAKGAGLFAVGAFMAHEVFNGFANTFGGKELKDYAKRGLLDQLTGGAIHPDETGGPKRPDGTYADMMPMSKQRRQINDFQNSVYDSYKRLQNKTINVFGKPIHAQIVVDDAKALARAQDTFYKLQKTAHGRKFIATLAIQTKGNQLAQQQIAKLAATKLGSKLLMILSRGGPEAAKWLAHIADTDLGTKLINIVQRGGPAAHKLVADLANKNIRDKVFRVIQHGGPDAQRQLERILGIHIRDKKFSVAVRDAASSVLHGVRSLIDSLHSKNVTITTTFRQIGRAIGSAASFVLGKAQGGPATAPDDNSGWNDSLWRMQQRAYDQAAASGPTKRRFGRFNKPALLVGEEHRDEYVIATNPAYRKTNVQYLSEAAREMGYQVVRAAARGKRPYQGITLGTAYGPMTSQVGHFTGDPHSIAFNPDLGALLPPGTAGQGAVTQHQQALAGQFSLDGLKGYRDRIKDLKDGQHQLEGKENGLVKKYLNDMNKAQADITRIHNQSVVHSRHHQSTKGDWAAFRAARRRYNQAEKKYKKHDKFDRILNRGGTWNNTKYMSLQTVDSMMSSANENVKQLQDWYDTRDFLSGTAKNAEVAAGTAAHKYSRTGDTTQLDEYHHQMQIHDLAIEQIKRFDQKAVDDITKFFKKYKTADLKKLLISMKGELADVNDELEINTDAALEDPTFVGPAAQTLENFLGTHGVLDSSSYLTLAQEKVALETAYSKTRIGDDSRLPATYADNEQAAAALETFWQTVYDNLVRSGAPDSMQGDAAENLADAQARHQSETANAHPAADIGTSRGLQLSTADTARQDVLAQFGSNIQGLAGLNPLSDPMGRGMGFSEVNPTMLMADYGHAGGASGISTAGQGRPGAGSVHVTNNFGAPPPDPHTWSQGVKFEVGAIL